MSHPPFRPFASKDTCLLGLEKRPTRAYSYMMDESPARQENPHFSRSDHDFGVKKLRLSHAIKAPPYLLANSLQVMAMWGYKRKMLRSGYISRMTGKIEIIGPPSFVGECDRALRLVIGAPGAPPLCLFTAGRALLLLPEDRNFGEHDCYHAKYFFVPKFVQDEGSAGIAEYLMALNDVEAATEYCKFIVWGIPVLCRGKIHALHARRLANPRHQLSDNLIRFCERSRQQLVFRS